MDMEPAKTIISYLGGARAVAEIVQKHPSRVYRWAYPSWKREGCSGLIPLRDQQRLLEYCREHGIDLVREDFFSHDRLAGILKVKDAANGPRANKCAAVSAETVE